MPVTHATPPVRQLLRRAERRESILAAAARAFARGGFAATSMEEIADEAGITKLIVYRHFDSKEDLYRGVLTRVSARIAEVFLAGMPTDRPSGIGVTAFLTVARENPDGFRLLWRHAAREAAFAQYAHELREQTVKGVRLMLSKVLGGHPSIEWASETVVSFIVESTLNWLEWGDPDRDAEFSSMTTGALRAMIGTWAAQAR